MTGRYPKSILDTVLSKEKIRISAEKFVKYDLVVHDEEVWYFLMHGTNKNQLSTNPRQGTFGIGGGR